MADDNKDLSISSFARQSRAKAFDFGDSETAPGATETTDTDTTTSTTPSQPQGEVTTQEYQEANPTHAMDEAIPEDNSLTGDEYKDMWFR